MSDPAQAPGFDSDYAARWLPALRRGRRAARRRSPTCGRGRLGRPVRDDAGPQRADRREPDVERFLYATGFSGHGFCQAPATGEVIRDLVLGREPFVDVTPLRAERFAERAPVVEANIV